MTYSGENLRSLSPITPKSSPKIEVTIADIGDFNVLMEDTDAPRARINFGKMINKSILNIWKENQYISSYKYVKRMNFTGTANYNLTLKGNYEHFNSSTLLTFLSVCTAFIIPATINYSYELTFELENTSTGKKYISKAYETTKLIQSLFFIFAIPWALSGEKETINKISETIYQDFVRQGAFQ